MTTLLIEPFGGMAGDMLLAALLDLGDARFTLADLEGLAVALVPGEAQLTLTTTRRGGLAASHLEVQTPESERPPARHLRDLEALIERARGALPEAACARSVEALRALAEAEARVHGTTPERIHFHEVGAVDTLIDVCGAALALERLGVSRVLATPPLLGSGTVRCAHGEMPVPAPAVAELLRGRATRQGVGGGERTTPTAAALLACWTTACGGEGLAVDAVGYGAGTRDPEEGPPNLVRVQLGNGAVAGESSAVWELGVNLDDMAAEELGHAVQALRAAGALEVWTSALAMKKDRPGTLVSALCRSAQRGALEAVVFELTTTLGVRWTRVERSECAREIRVVEVAGREVRVKCRVRPEYPGRSADGERDLFPEHDDVVALAEAQGWTLREARARAIERALRA